MNERVFVIGEASSMKARFRACWNICEEMIKAGSMELILRPRKSKRSIDQNKRYWALLREISATVWIGGKQYSDAAWHEQFKRWFIGMEDVAMPDGSTEQRGMSTTTLSVAEFTDYMTQIEQWAADQGYPVMMEAA